MAPKPRIMEIGSTWNYFTLLKDLNIKKYRSRLCLAQCHCGSIVKRNYYDICNGKIKSCGCMKGNVIHRKSKTPIYRLYYRMIGRCYNPNIERYEHYGGKGITVCDEWTKSYDAFETWAKRAGYRKGLSIDRIDVNGDYSPTNCRFVTETVQATNRGKSSKNTSGAKGIHFSKKSKKWIARIGINNKRVYLGLYKSFEEAKQARHRYCIQHNLIEHLRGDAYS